MKIEDELTAFQFDAAVAFERRNHETELEKGRANLLVAKIAAMFAGRPDPDENGREKEEPEEW